MRVWDSITVPQLGGIPLERAVNFCFPDRRLAEMYRHPDRDFCGEQECALLFRELRGLNRSPLVNGTTTCAWRSLVCELRRSLATAVSWTTSASTSSELSSCTSGTRRHRPRPPRWRSASLSQTNGNAPRDGVWPWSRPGPRDSRAWIRDEALLRWPGLRHDHPDCAGLLAISDRYEWGAIVQALVVRRC